MKMSAPPITDLRMAAVPPVNITTPEFKAQAVEFYARLRREAPVYRTVLPTNSRFGLCRGTTRGHGAER